MSKSEDELFESSVVSYKILVVCKGNTCRSIMYHSILADRLKTSANTEIFSAGIETKDNYNISDNTLSVLAKKNIPLAKEKPQHISEFKGMRFDKVFVLEKSYTIKELSDIKCNNIHFCSFPDPDGENIEQYKAVMASISAHIKKQFPKNP